MSYDPSNIFARILKGEIPCQKVHESAMGLAFHDIAPQAPIHVLAIPKGPYTSSADFYARASEAEIAGFYRFLGEVIDKLGIRHEGFRMLSNHGLHAGQEVPHFHVHIFAGRPLGPMLSKTHKA